MQNKGFPADFLYQLKQRSDIVSIVSRYTRLDKKGSRYWGCCPFHNEKTPSFSVMQDEGQFYCFGCKEYGDVISFVQKIESCEFMDAVKILAEQAHMEMPKITASDDDTHKRAKEKERLLALLDATWKHYHENLYLPQAKPAQDYIKSRNFTRHELDDFKIGYSLNWNEMIDYLKGKGFTIKEMEDAGVAQSKDGRAYDVLGGRLVFPIFNAFNDCVGFSARAIEKTDFAKYKNTAETMVFQKSKVVFGINLLKQLKQAGELKNIIIVEGQIDVIAMHRAGFKSTVACMGSALTHDNAQILKRISRDIVLCFDGDAAGQKATLNALEVLGNTEFNIRVVMLPNGNDPDEILKNKGRDYLANLIDNAMPVMDYLIEVEKKKYNLNAADQRGKFAKAVLAHLRKMDSPSEAEPYLEKVRDLTSIPIDILRRDLIKEPAPTKTAMAPEKNEEEGLGSRENGNIRAIKFVLASLIHGKDYVDKKVDYSLLLPRYKALIEEAKKGTRISSYYDLFEVDENPMLRDCLLFNFEEYNTTAPRYFSECLWSLADQALKEQQSQLTEQFKKAETLEERQKIMLKLNNINKQLREKSLEEFYGRN